ncbi:MAG TPA: RidA family protein [Candidatus Methylomirabilis sp.]|nr:RidA family protein [Candidatus Methylomirabilis sp.]
MRVEESLRQRGLAVPVLAELWRANPAGGHYISHFPVRNLLYLCGTTPVKDGAPYLPGVLGKDLTVAQGQEAARYAVLTTLGVIKHALGDLDRVERFVHLLGFVNSSPGFNDQPRVINGAVDLLIDLYGERGKPTRAAIGCQGLGAGASVEVIATLLFSGDEVEPPFARDHFER